MSVEIRYRRGTAAEWAAADPVLAEGEPGWETDTGVRKTGDGVTAWSGLAVDVAEPTEAFKTELNNTYATFDVTSDAAALPDATEAFVTAASSVSATGRTTLRVAPGTYHVPGLHPDDIGGLFVVGDGVALTGPAWVYPFTTREWVNRAADDSGTGGRGVVAFEVDDALAEHWTHLFPLTKELGITLGNAWHTDNGAQWITEAHRHGWEFMFHMSNNVDTTTLTPAQIDAEAQAGLAAIGAATGVTEGIGFVYPQHLRNAETDRILSKYFTRGRGLASAYIYPRTPGRPWLVSSWAIDPHLADGVVSEALKRTLRTVAATDGRMVMYFHFNNISAPTHSTALRELVAFIRAQGIAIQNPRQVWGERNVTADPYDLTSNEWTLSNANLSRTAEASYHGSHSFKLTVPSSGPSGGTITQAAPQIVASRPGHFSVWRVSMRYKTPGTAVTSPGQGIGFLGAVKYRTLDSTSTTGVSTQATQRYPRTGTTLAAAEWERLADVVHLGPSAMFVSLSASLQNIVADGVVYVDEIKMELLDYVSTVTARAPLNGTGYVFIYPNVVDLDRYAVQVTPLAPIAGQLEITVTNTRVSVRSTDASDTAEVLVNVLPGASYDSMTLPSTGA